jgi:hypothetical protein
MKRDVHKFEKNRTIMENKEKKNLLKILIPIVIVWGVIKLFNAGYLTGKWLYIISH